MASSEPAAWGRERYRCSMAGTPGRWFASTAAALSVLTLTAAVLPAPAAQAPGSGAVGEVVARASVTSAGVQSASESRVPAISGDGRFVAFESAASDLVPGDTNGVTDIFVHDRQTGALERVSVASDGTEANAESHNASLSDDGRFVAFESVSWELVPADNNERTDIFVYDRTNDVIEIVSESQSNEAANGHSINPTISADGVHVAFESLATNLVDGDPDANSVSDVFVVDLATDLVERVSVSTAGAEADGESHEAAISADGSVVAFESAATDLVASDTNAVVDVFVRDRSGSLTERASVSALGAQAAMESVLPSVSGDGSLVAYSSQATNLVPGDTNGTEDVFVRDRDTDGVVLGSIATDGTQADQPSSFVELSGDGTSIAFVSRATNLVPVDTNNSEDIFVRHLVLGETRRASVGSAGQQPDFRSYEAAISSDGDAVAFDSVARNLLPSDTNFRRDVFVVDTSACLSGFVDVAFAHPFCDDIYWLGGSGITGGYADGGFHPSDQVTRQATAAFLYRYDGSPAFVPPNPVTFTDVGMTHPFRTPIEWLAASDITGGYADGGFHPTAQVTRQAFASFLFRFADPTFTPPGTPTFTDVPTSHPFFAAIEWLASTGVTSGYPDGGFHPTSVITRQAIAAFLHRYDDL